MDNIQIEKEILEEKKSISHMRTFLLLFLVGVVMGFTLFYYSTSKHVGRQKEDYSVTDTRLENIENTVSLHEKRIAKLEEQAAKPVAAPTAAGSPAAANDNTNEKIASLEKEIKSLKFSAAPQDPEHVAQAITLLSSFHRLSNAIVGGKPFAAELSSFLENFGADTDKSLNDIIAPLSPYADSGIPNSSTLNSVFDEALATMKKNEALPPDNAGFWEKLVFNITHMITIRRIDKSQGGISPDAIIGRADDDLNGEETEAAIAEIKSLPDNVRSNFNAWLEDAQISSIAPSVLDQIEEKVMKKAFSASAKPQAAAAVPASAPIAAPKKTATPAK